LKTRANFVGRAKHPVADEALPGSLCVISRRYLHAGEFEGIALNSLISGLPPRSGSAMSLAQSLQLDLRQVSFGIDSDYIT
jgi:hypothetical protein